MDNISSHHPYMLAIKLSKLRQKYHIPSGIYDISDNDFSNKFAEFVLLLSYNNKNLHQLNYHTKIIRIKMTDLKRKNIKKSDIIEYDTFEDNFHFHFKGAYSSINDELYVLCINTHYDVTDDCENDICHKKPGLKQFKKMINTKLYKCKKCDGNGKVNNTYFCNYCNGKGKVLAK